MNRTWGTRTLASIAVVVALSVSVAAACSTAGPAPSASPAASPKASAPSPIPSAPSPSASVKPPSAEEQAYQKVLANWQKVVEAARKEGEAVLYSVGELDSLRMYEQAFNKLDPQIKVKYVRATGAQASERLKAEAATKQYVSNGYSGGSPSTRAMADQGLGQLLDDLPVLYEPGIQWIRPPLFDKPKETLTTGLNRYFVMVNNNLVPPGQEPKTWKDLGDPKWKDKIVLWDPRVTGIGQYVLSVLYLNPDYGPDLVRKIVDNIRVVADMAEGSRFVARGEMAMSVLAWQSYVAVKDGPVRMVPMEDGVIVAATQVTVAKTAPQLNVMKVYFNWYLGKEGQRLVSEGSSALRPDVDFITKETQVAGVKFLPNVPASYDFEMTKMKEVVPVLKKWLDDAGK